MYFSFSINQVIFSVFTIFLVKILHIYLTPYFMFVPLINNKNVFINVYYCLIFT